MLCKSPSLPIKTEEETLSLNYRKIWGALILFFRFYTLLRAGERVEGFFSIRSYSLYYILHALNITILPKKSFVFPIPLKKTKMGEAIFILKIEHPLKVIKLPIPSAS